MAEKPLGAQISEMLKDRGVEVIFGIPGVHNQEMYRGIEQAGIMHVLARHEQGAGFMADGYARATGKPGVAYIITGPGVTNIMTALGQAYSDSVSVLAISSCLDETAAIQGQLHQMLDQETAAGTVCDWSHTAKSAQSAYDLIDRALVEFSTQRKRSKHIQVPIRLLEANAPTPPVAPKPASPMGDKGAAKKIKNLLSNAKKPLFIFGGGMVGADAKGLLDCTGAAGFMTYAGRGLVDGHPLSFGASLARVSSMEVIAQSDLVIAMGTELAEVDLWRQDLGHTCPLVRVDIDPVVLSDRHRAEVALLANAIDVTQVLCELFASAGGQTDWRPSDIEKQLKTWRSEVEVERPGILQVADALRAALPKDTMIFSDMTQFAYATKEAWPMAHPGYWHHPTGFGTLGYAVPAAIGGAVGRKGKPTIAIAGDYGFQYTVQELATAAELELSLPIILWDNGKLKEIEESMQRAQIAPNAVIAKNPDFGKLADAYGLGYARPDAIDAISNAVAAAFAAQGPMIIHLTPDVLW